VGPSLELYGRVDVLLAKGRGELDVVAQVQRMPGLRIAGDVEVMSHAALIVELADVSVVRAGSHLLRNVTWSVEELPDGGGRVTLVHDGWSEAGADAATRGDHEGYWSGYLDDLTALLAEPD